MPAAHPNPYDYINRFFAGDQMNLLFKAAILLWFQFTPIPKDSLLSHLEGQWIASGKVAGIEKRVDITAEWVLNNQYLHIREKDLGPEKPYQADIYLGWDTTAQEYQIHWLDIFGPKYLAVLGHGTRRENVLVFTFKDYDGETRNTWTWDGTGWAMLIEQRAGSDPWQLFAQERLSKK